MLNKDDFQQIQDTARKAVHVLEKRGYAFIYAGENERVRCKELRVQGINKIRVVPWQRSEPDAPV